MIVWRKLRDHHTRDRYTHMRRYIIHEIETPNRDSEGSGERKNEVTSGRNAILSVIALRVSWFVPTIEIGETHPLEMLPHL